MSAEDSEVRESSLNSFSSERDAGESPKKPQEQQQTTSSIISPKKKPPPLPSDLKPRTASPSRLPPPTTPPPPLASAVSSLAHLVLSSPPPSSASEADDCSLDPDADEADEYDGSVLNGRGANPPIVRKRSSLQGVHPPPKPKLPPPPPPPIMDLASMYVQSREHAASSAAGSQAPTPCAIFSGRTVVDFDCKVKSYHLGILRAVKIELDLKELNLKMTKGTEVENYSIDSVLSSTHAKKNSTEVEVHFLVGEKDAPVSLSQMLGTKHERRWVFASSDEALRFQTHLDVMRESGRKLKQIFDELDRRNTGHINTPILQRAMKENGMDGPKAADDAVAMIALADQDTSDGIDFVEFFRLFMFTPCTTVHQCLTEWRNKVALDQTRRKSVDLSRTSMNDAHAREGRMQPTKKNKFVIPGEVVMNVVENVRYGFGYKARENLDGDHFHWVGSLSVTNYRLVLQSHISGANTVGTRHEVSDYFDRMDIPANAISKIEKLDSSCVLIMCKDLRAILCSFEPNDVFVTTLVTAIQSVAFPGGPEHTFAFQYKETFGLSKGLENGWDLYDSNKEFERIGVLNSPHARFYRIWSDNFSLSDTYPRQFCLPSGMGESDIMQAAKFRSKCRMPAVSWRSKKNGAVIVRSAQPMVGLKSSRNAADEKLLNLYRVKGDTHNPQELEEPSTLYILDARKMIAATGNQVQGKGTEIVSNYAHTELQFCNIENIHIMRDSVNALSLAVIPQDRGESKISYESQVNNSMWLRHVQMVLKASVAAVERIELNDSSVHIHCSDGWDRTAQMTSTAMLLLDPYYRTIKGFAIIIEKEWLEFGHKFGERIGQGDDKKKDERSPVFVQWLDVVHQVMLQYPHAFEFNDRLLVFIADMMHSSLFGTFLGNCAREREELDVKKRTVSIWTYVLARKEEFTNNSFAEYHGTLWPSTSFKQMQLFARYFCRFDFEMHPRGHSGQKWVDEWGRKETEATL